MRADSPFRVVAPEARVEGTVDAGYLPSPSRVRVLARQGLPVLVRCGVPPGSDDPPPDLGEILALVSVYAWLGATVVATDHPREAGQALEMVAAVRGLHPPRVARRGLA